MKNPESILLVIDGFGEGGIQQAYISLINEYCDLFDEVYLLVLQATGSDLKFNSKANLQIIRLKATNLVDIFSFVRFFYILHSLKPHYVIASMYRSQVWAALSKPKKTILVWVEHNTYFKRKKSQWTLMRLVIQKVDKLVSVSNEVKRISELNLKKKFITIPNPSSFRTISEKTSRRNLDFVFVARMVPQKNPELMLFSFAKFISKFETNSNLHMIGDGELLKSLRETAKNLNLSKRCKFYGKITNNEVRKILATSSTLVSTSVIEGMPLVRLEAIVSGCCVVTTKTGGIHFFKSLKNSGFFVSEGTIEDLANLMMKSINKVYWTEEMVNKRISITRFFEPKLIAKKLIVV